MRARSIRPSDDSPFVNEVFNTEFTDYMYSRPDDERAALLAEFGHTNYAVADLELIQQIFEMFYQQKVRGESRMRFLRRHDIHAARATADGIHLTMCDQNTGRESTSRYDAVVLATGYAREQHKELLTPLAPYLDGFSVDRHYRVRSTGDFRPAIFLQGACESSHGLSDTLLSVTSVRTGEIGSALLKASAANTGRSERQAVRIQAAAEAR
jgi:L-ornithine N5-oxygenase